MVLIVIVAVGIKGVGQGGSLLLSLGVLWAMGIAIRVPTLKPKPKLWVFNLLLLEQF